MIQDYIHEVDKELFLSEQIQHVLADRTNCRISVASLSVDMRNQLVTTRDYIVAKNPYRLL